ncbi:cyclopropane fatty acid synthase [Dentipellis sp. KUC8613]|nr:cyclopropane fatty acid synthase [Dentipellis sp. KUC8613]
MEQPSALQHPLPSISLYGITSSLTSSLPNYHSSLATFARDSIIRTLKQSLTIGCLEIQDYRGVSRCGNFDGKTNVIHMKVLNEHFWTQVLIRGDLGFSEAYMMGDVQVDDLKGVMKLWLENESGMANLTSTIGRVSSAMSGVWNALFGQTRSNARLNAIASYDQSNELFKTFLSRDMMYSCALWGDEEGGVRGDLTGRKQEHHDLESAQLRKIHHVLRKARVKPGSRVLEVGSGWGSMAIEAARSYGCQVDTLTLSIEQKKLAEERIAAAGLQDQIRVHLMDYRELPADFEKAFDAFISIEMLEVHKSHQCLSIPTDTWLQHVGAKYYDTYFRMVDWALKPHDATVVVSSSTFPESRYSGYQAQDFMRKYMWPNSCLPSATVLVNAAHDASKRRFTLDSVENHSAHYPRTLREWDRRLDEKLTQDTLASDFPKLKADKAAFDAFKRKWQYLFAYAGAGFAKGYITCHMLTFIRERDTPISCD